MSPISTDFDGSNPTEFSQTVKGWPVILPNGDIVVFACDGVKEQSGFLCQMGGDPFVGAIQCAYADDYFTHDQKKSAWADDAPGSVRVPNADRTVIVFDRTYLSGFFTTSDDKKTLGGFWIHPIPFSAALGVNDWKGSSLTTGMASLENVLEALRTDLGGRNQWTLDDATWADVDWKDYRYSVQGLQPTYAGVVDEVKSVFHATPGS
jgi:hypothetical protein